MAKYQVTRACGHVETMSFTGPTPKRERDIEYQERFDCESCADAERQKENVAAAEAAKAAGWPTLTGSERQAAWAETLRAKAVRLVRAEADGWRKVYPEAKEDIAELIERQALRVTSARWWIDSRASVGANILEVSSFEVARALGLLEQLDDARLKPHTILGVRVTLRWQGAERRQVLARAAACACGWFADAVSQANHLGTAGAGVFRRQAEQHIEGLDGEERAAVERAHPETPHLCTEELGRRYCVMEHYLGRI